MGTLKDLKEAMGLAAEFEANRSACSHRQSVTVRDQSGVRATSKTNEVLETNKNKESTCAIKRATDPT